MAIRSTLIVISRDSFQLSLKVLSLKLVLPTDNVIDLLAKYNGYHDLLNTYLP